MVPSINRPVAGLRLLNNRDDRWWSVTVLGVQWCSDGRTGRTFESVETFGEGWRGFGACDLDKWPSRYVVGLLPIDHPIVEVQAGLPSPSHGQPLLRSLRFGRMVRFDSEDNARAAVVHWPHLDDAIALFGGPTPYAEPWDLARIDGKRAALAALMSTVETVSVPADVLARA